MPQPSIQELLAEMEATVEERRELLARDLDLRGLSRQSRRAWTRWERRW